jgi:pyruvate-ferredoxin/flavodoxin oxidoreductase
MAKGLTHQRSAVEAGLWPLLRYDPRRAAGGERPLVLDSPAPRVPVREVAYREARYRMLTRMDPPEAERLIRLAQEEVDQRWRLYELLASGGPGAPAAPPAPAEEAPAPGKPAPPRVPQEA